MVRGPLGHKASEGDTVCPGQTSDVVQESISRSVGNFSLQELLVGFDKFDFLERLDK